MLIESVGNREVQTNFSALEEQVQIQFKEGGLSYMEKLLLKKYKRTSVDEMPGGHVKDLRPAQIQTALHEAVTAEEEQEDAGVADDITVEEVRRYWTNVFREEVPKNVPESAESTLKIEFLDDAFYHLSLWSLELYSIAKCFYFFIYFLNESYDSGLEESRNFSVLEAESTGMNKQRNIEPFEEFGKCEKRRDNFGSGIADQENAPLDHLPKETVAVMRKSSCHSSFTANNQYLLPSPLDGDLASSKEILRGNDFIRPRSVDVLQHKLTGHGAKNTHGRPKSSPMPVFRDDTEIPKHECVDVIKKDEHYWEHIADQEALLGLEQELQTYVGPQEKLCSLTSEDVTSSSRCSRKIYGNITDFHKTLELEDLSRADVLG
ncbi:hypothetical protein ASZ78_012330 [Callipepla squamata]|uniref:Uncharacterized protein n=1 Tax=Callipepla squamata TaxID=9009 RepID=A0A226N464_CALSU|nr:hypothetical protein ASZ78_012330 [Callipepla squamata]